ncbi:hypothetical protein C9374_010824 [Naegleria lovaniensis]|uniref:RUN domain-containing protein n=1 Tax=Naegleria lovaniensis TaxID=51637 RepID=A0AA88KD98_NAELO|nr:uncharacterized protein C9374_010824 [Naegleria lovaniensis]KAG2374540.1 hypothetical protein C9374_010824 [Naegleria lovaniensis]
MKLQDEEDRLVRIQEALKLKVAERENLELELAQETNKTSQLLEQQQRDNAEKQDLLHNLSQTHRVLEEQHDHMTTSIKSLELALNQKQQERHDLEELLRKEQSTLEAERKQLTESEQQKSVHQEKLKALQQEHATLTSLIKKEETVLRVEKENLKRLQNDIQTLQRKQSQLEEEVKQRKSIMTSEATEQANGHLTAILREFQMIPMSKSSDDCIQISINGIRRKERATRKKESHSPSKVNKKPTPAPIEIIDSLLTDLHKKGINDEFPQDDKKHYILPLNYDPLIVMVQQYACILCDKCIMGKGDLSRFYHMVFPKLLESLASHIKSEQHDMEAQQRYKKLFTKLRHVKKTFSEFEHVKTLEASKEYATLSLLFIFYAFIYGVFSKEFWDYYCSAVDFLKEHYESSSSLLMNADSREDLLFLVKKQSKFKCILSDFETVADHQKEVAELLLVDHHNCHQCLSMPPLERLKGVLYEIRQVCFRNSSSGGDSMSGQNSQAISELLQLKFTASLLSTYEIGFRQFKFFGRYFFWDYLKFYLEKVATKQSSNETSTLIQELYQHANERLTLLVSKEPNDLKFALFVSMAINKRKLEEIFTPLFTNPQIAEYFSEDAIVRSDKVKDVLWVLAQIDSFTTLPTIDISQMNNMHFDYAKGAWIGMQ